jgi:SAM-dependent methyltransferase
MGLLGRALRDYYIGLDKTALVVECDRAADEDMNRAQFFTEEVLMPRLDRLALTSATGRVLDVGAGAGRHTLALQQRGLQVDALEADADCTALCEDRGALAVLHTPWQAYAPGPVYDTTLALMNGLGLCGTYTDLPFYLSWHLALLKKGGKAYLDTSSVGYLRPPADKSRRRDEVWFRFRYGQETADWFSWLFADKAEAERQMRRAGFINVSCLFSEPNGRYLLCGQKP